MLQGAEVGCQTHVQRIEIVVMLFLVIRDGSYDDAGREDG